MPKSDSLGQFEQLVLTAIVGLGDDAYGIKIHNKVEELSAPRKITLAAIYVTLDRLEQKGMVSSWFSASTAERGGRRKRCYKLEQPGERALKEAMQIAYRMAESVAAAWQMPKQWGKA